MSLAGLTCCINWLVYLAIFASLNSNAHALTHFQASQYNASRTSSLQNKVGLFSVFVFKVLLWNGSEEKISSIVDHGRKVVRYLFVYRKCI